MAREKESLLLKTIVNRLRMTEDITPYITVSKNGKRAVINNPDLFEYIYRRWKFPQTDKSNEFNIVISRGLVPKTYTIEYRE